MSIDNILEIIAENNGITVEELEEEMHEVIRDSMEAPSAKFKEAFGDREPSVEEFLKAIISDLNKKYLIEY